MKKTLLLFTALLFAYMNFSCSSSDDDINEDGSSDGDNYVNYVTKLISSDYYIDTECTSMLNAQIASFKINITNNGSEAVTGYFIYDFNGIKKNGVPIRVEASQTQEIEDRIGCLTKEQRNRGLTGFTFHKEYYSHVPAHPFPNPINETLPDLQISSFESNFFKDTKAPPFYIELLSYTLSNHTLHTRKGRVVLLGGKLRVDTVYSKPFNLNYNERLIVKWDEIKNLTGYNQHYTNDFIFIYEND